MRQDRLPVNLRSNQNYDLAVQNIMRMGKIAKLNKNQVFQNMIMASCLSGDMSLLNDIKPYVTYKAVEEMFREFPFATPTEEDFLR